MPALRRNLQHCSKELDGGEHMGKTRVYEYAKSNNISSKDVISKLKEMNIEVTNHMSTIDGNAIEKLDSIFKKNSKNESNSKYGNGKPKEQNQPKKATTRINMEDEEDIYLILLHLFHF